MSTDDDSTLDSNPDLSSGSMLDLLPADRPLPASGRAGVFAALRQTLDVSFGGTGRRDPDLFVREMRRRRAVLGAIGEGGGRRVAGKRAQVGLRSVWYAVGAIVASAILVGVWKKYDSTLPGNSYVAGRTYSTAIGQVSTVTLPDGSHVILAPQTSLVLDEKFLHGSRAVTLRGEAYFTVNANQSAPFIVHSGHVSTRVLGTTFDIKHYDEDRDVHVCVTAGKVLVSPVVPAASRLSPVVLFAGRAAQISDSTAVVTMIDGTNVSTAWTDGRLVFAGASVAEVLATVGRWYGYQFRISDTGLAQQHITATLEPSSAKDMLSVLRLALDVTMTFDGNVVTLYPNTTSAEPRRRRDLNAVPQPRTEVGR